MSIIGIHHVNLLVDDLDAARRFYGEVFGFTELARPDFGFPGAWLDTGNGQQVHLIGGETPPNLGQHFAFFYEDLPSAIASLRATGLDVTDPVDVGTTGRKQAFTSDPWGNAIELHQRPAR